MNKHNFQGNSFLAYFYNIQDFLLFTLLFHCCNMVNTFDIWLGEARWNDGGMGVMRTDILIPMNTGMDQTPCGAALGRRLLSNPNEGSGPGNFACDGCSGGGPWDWWVDTFYLGWGIEFTPESATVTGDLIIERWPSDNDNYWVTDDAGKWHAVCTWPDEEEWESCYASGPIEVVRYLNCEAVPDRGDDYTIGIQFAG
ncbi:hypothetical protein CC79DRAFT_1364729 [Sarocladium strictum]